ncbi:MAG: tRNA (adenosine(37)-N6)-threonylcarbamoyltransferase complex dimerization subunit type 1 TsaB [Bacteroidia bacterium]|nr:tRNA (adenosine(37)-N6)-threonylcarbamoyltransferase complex dimerization subunit type 1 TsaB [Bacteroidia bacterium]MDW8089374.1 tRNA (adenosine(37)-N6)-threonylcarbamoyltransferase complex dimerization subunit type 1 TsaB [Bacteroidia bacterium]
MIEWKLVVETSGPSLQVGLLRDGEIEGGIRWDWPRRQAEYLITVVEQVLATSQLQWSDIQGVIYHQGPGSHTGLRIGLAAVKAWALSLGWAVYPVGLMEVLRVFAEAKGARAQRLFTFWESRPASWYGQLWEGGVPLTSPRLAPLAEWEALAQGAFWVGNSLKARLPVWEVQWPMVAEAGLRTKALRQTAEIVALMPLYFRPFEPNRRRHL